MTKRKTPPASLPTNWDAPKLQRVLTHYEGQNEEDAVREDEGAFDHRDTSMIEVPAKLVPEIREFLAKRGAA